MKLNQCMGYELEKAQSNTSEDFFNQSEVIFTDQGEEKTFHLLYVRYFDEQLLEVIPFDQEPLFTSGDRSVTIKDIVGLICLLSNPSFRKRKRVYINSVDELISYFKGFNYNMLQDLFEKLGNNQPYTINPSIIYSMN
ncbi:hypothetical protein [Litchfieldia alkalitelluris]|uniref:hypothetical protein n=1 Tax=Litchfieldia alkalitelluris TaxID=304268 RepID=UPI00099757CB|nr:hypothetical protein [Litchfieldia alkalitelluris]